MNTPNAEQTDSDSDSIGDACDNCPLDADNDIDGDAVCGDVDNCASTPNPDQDDADGDNMGDACDNCPLDADNDIDDDAVCGDVDNCMSTPNPDQADSDGDGIGDACDSCPYDADNDIDGDAVCGDVDNCVATPNTDQADSDGDSMGDACDNCPLDADNDADGDGLCGDVDNCPFNGNVDQLDSDSDGAGDICDPCPIDPTNSDPDAEVTDASDVIGPDGGALANANGEMTIVVEPGEIAEESTLTIAKMDPEELGGIGFIEDQATHLIYEVLGPSPAAKLTMCVDAALVQDPANVYIARYEDPDWVAKPTIVELVDGKVCASAVVDHTSLWGLFEILNQPPVAVCKDAVLQADSGCAAAVALNDIDGGIHDPDGDDDIASISMTPDSLSGTGTYDVVVVVVDSYGEQDSCTAVVTVADLTEPIMTCPANTTVEAEGPDGTTVPLAATATDNCTGSPAISGTELPVYPLGDTEVTFTATDDAGNQASCVLTVSVVDSTPPVISLAVTPDLLWPPNHKLVEIAAAVEVTDVADSAPLVVLQSIVSNEPDDAPGNGDGKTTDDIQAALGTEAYSFWLRAERAGAGSGRVYTVTYMATDASGNPASTSVDVFVPHSQ